MRSTEVAARFGLGLIVALCAACTTATSSASPASPSAAEPQPSATPSPSPSSAPPTEPPVAGIEVPALGHPFDAASLLSAMRESRRPGGVPDQLETEAIAASVAEAIWTYGGVPWSTQAVVGSCGPESCTLEVAGAAPGAPSDDVWVFAVTPSTGEVRLLAAELGSVPPEIVAELDDMARSLDEGGSLEGMILASASWLPPPQAGQFVLSYRSGGEEGSCGIDITLDAVNAGIVGSSSIGC